MDPRFNDPKFQVQMAKKLTSSSPLERRVAHQLLQKNGLDVTWATAKAKEWKAAQDIVDQGRAK
jgi:hypothetical protein